MTKTMTDALIPSRRRFLQGLAGLAAFAVSSPALGVLSEPDAAKFLRMAKKGLVSDTTFRIRGTVTLIVDRDMTITNCIFIYDDKLTKPFMRIIDMEERHKLLISCCTFISESHYLTGIYIPSAISMFPIIGVEKLSRENG
jgi:hypothetical protein